MEEEKEIGIKFIAMVTGLKGTCHANHKAGQKFELNCYDSGGLCGFFYHDIFPYLNAIQFGGKYPWWDKDLIEVECPDRYNTVSLKVQRKLNKTRKDTKKQLEYNHVSHTFGFKKIVQFYIDGKPMESGEVEELLGTRSLQQYCDNPDKTFIVMDSRGRKYKLITRIVDEEYWERPRHKK